MALFNPTLGDIRGSIAGNTFSRNRFGAYIRIKVTPVNPSTPAQVAARSSFTGSSQDWRDVLDETNRINWNVYAAGTPLTNIFGNQYFATGAQMQLRGNTLLKLVGEGIDLDGPQTPGQAPMSAPNPATGLLHDETSTLPDQFSFGADVVADFNQNLASQFLLGYVGLLHAPSVSFYKGPFQFVDFIQGDPVTPPTELVLPLPFNVPLGARVFFKFRRLTLNGRVGPPFIDSRIAINVL